MLYNVTCLFLSLVLINVYTVTPDLRPVNDKVIETFCHVEAGKVSHPAHPHENATDKRTKLQPLGKV